MSPRQMICSARCWPPDRLRRYCCTVSTKVVGRCWNTRVRGACRRESASRTLCCCRTARSPRTTPRWWRPPWRCSVGRRGQREVCEIEAGHHDTCDKRRLVVARPGTLPVARGDRELRLLACGDVAAEQMRCGSRLFGAELQ